MRFEDLKWMNSTSSERMKDDISRFIFKPPRGSGSSVTELGMHHQAFCITTTRGKLVA